jgi:aminoglycoside phosphotransferase (APT) family kinase protein
MTPERLAAFLATVEPDTPARVRSCRFLPGGYSRTTAVADIEWSDGRVEAVVLRGDPPLESGVFTSDRDAEWTLLRAIWDAAAVPVPRPRWYDSEGTTLGTKCMVSDRCPGPSLHEMLGAGGDQGRGTELFLAALVSVHRAPLSALPEQLLRDTGGDDYLDGALEVFDRLAETVAGAGPVLRHVGETLRRRRPPPVPLTLVHGDWQPGNVLVPDDGPPLVIDWEFAHVGDPREDLGYYLQIPMEPHLYRRDPEGYLARYRELTGLTREQVNPDVLQWFLVLGTTRVLLQMVQAADAVAQGRPRGVLATYLINAVSHFHSLYLDAARRVEATSWPVSGSPR